MLSWHEVFSVPKDLDEGFFIKVSPVVDLELLGERSDLLLDVFF